MKNLKSYFKMMKKFMPFWVIMCFRNVVDLKLVNATWTED